MACRALHFYPTDDAFKACCKKGDVVLPQIHELLSYLSYLSTGNDPLY
jgi:hypothetical protein